MSDLTPETLAELESRLKRAAHELDCYAANAVGTEKNRLAGKAEGVRLALDYLRFPGAIGGIDELRAERDALAAAVERVRELHTPEGIHRFCSMCAYRPWPCPTIRALDESETDSA